MPSRRASPVRVSFHACLERVSCTPVHHGCSAFFLGFPVLSRQGNPFFSPRLLSSIISVTVLAALIYAMEWALDLQLERISTAPVFPTSPVLQAPPSWEKPGPGPWFSPAFVAHFTRFFSLFVRYYVENSKKKKKKRTRRSQ